MRQFVTVGKGSGTSLASSSDGTATATEKLFVGPFASWKSIKADYGARGDGVTDDTVSIQRALDDLKLVSSNSWTTLYFPAGVYRITVSLKTSRVSHHDFLGAQIVGEDPQTTTLLWDGPPKGPMLVWDAWYDKISRITFEGAGKAEHGIIRAGGFSTYSELSDLFFKNISGGCLILSNGTGGGIAEQYIVRNRFYNCGTGVTLWNYNTLDIYAWNNYFQDCNYGIYTATGAFHAYENRFVRSNVSDLRLGSNQITSVTNNSSAGSKSFISGDGTPVLAGNKIWNSSQMAMDLSLMGSALLIGNKINFTSTKFPAILAGPASFVVGNIFETNLSWPFRTVPHPFNHGEGGSAVIGHEIEKLIDDDPSTYAVLGMWAENAGGVQWNSALGRSQKVVSYSLTAAQNTSAGVLLDPMDFALFGSNDWGGSWVELDRRSGITFDPRSQKKIFTLANGFVAAYSIYQLRVLKTRGDIVPGAGGFSGFAEFELLDSAGQNLLHEPGSLISGSDEGWGSLFTDTLNFQKITPQILEPFAIPIQVFNSTVVEVAAYTGEAIQKAIDDSKANLQSGITPVIHLKKGNYAISKTLVIPPSFTVHIVGDGASEHGTVLSWTGSSVGPIAYLQGPSQATMKDLGLSGGAGLLIDRADQAGGLILGHQVNIGGGGGNSLASVAGEVNGLTMTKVSLIAYGMSDFKTGFRVSGPTTGVSQRVDLLTGASSHGCRLYDVRNGGRLLVTATWYEGDTTCDSQGAMIDLSDVSSSGDLTMSSMLFSVLLENPFLRTQNFHGQVSILGSQIDQRPLTQLQFLGDGSASKILSIANSFPQYGSSGTIPKRSLAQIVDDSTNPSDQTFFINSLIPNLKRFYASNGSLPNSSSESLAQQLAPLIQTRIFDSPSVLGATHVELFRVQIRSANQQRALMIQADPK